MLPLERPVLSLTIDAVVNMNGEDALCGLLTLFHKCKDGLQDGDRLENMAWRLWHVERASSQDDLPASAALASPGGVASLLTSSSSTCSDGSSEVSSDGETWDQDQATTVQEDTGPLSEKDASSTLSDRAPFQDVPSCVRAQPPKRAACKHRSLSPTSSTSTRMPNRRPSLASRRTHSNTSIGQIMADLLPEKLDLHTSLKALTEQRVDKTRPPPVPGGGDRLPAVIVMPETQLQQPRPRPSPPLSTQLDPSVRFPTVVIVNPTPHPTPPMTPQVSSPPTTSPTYSDVSNAPRRDTLTVVTNLRSPMSPTLPPTPESMGEESANQQPLGSASETKPLLLSSGSRPRSEARNNGSTGGVVPNGIPAGKSIAANNDTSNAFRSASGLPTGAPGSSGSSLNPPERKFFISQAGSPDCDSPDTSASSQVGSQSGISASVVVPLSVVDTKAVDMIAGGDPASVTSRSSALTTRSGSSNGSSAHGGNGLRMKSRKAGASSNAKGKAKECRPSALQRSHSSNRIFRLQTVAGGLTGGTIQRSKLGGRTAAATAATAHPGTLVPSQFARQQSSRLPPTSGVSVHPPPPASVSKLVKAEKSKAEKPTATSSSDSRPQSATRRTSSSRRSSKSGSSIKGPKPSASTLQNSQRRLEIADDSDYSTESEEWDTEDVSEEAERDNEKAIADRKLAEAAAEAQRQRELFAKVDRRSYSDLTRVRTQPGLLSTIFHPDPALFPPDHPYRHSRSTQDILAHVNRPAYMPAPLQPTRSAAAAPVAATVTAQGVGTPTQTHTNNSRQRSPLRLKGRPMDVEESDSGEDDNNKLHISESVAEKRLAMLQRQSTKGAPKGPSRPPAPDPQQPLQRPDVYPAVGQAPVGRYGIPDQGPSGLARVSTEPIPLGYPYNLPPPIPPSTPRTTRRNMLTNELSESLRRNLLWERRVSKQRPIGLQRRAVTNGAPPARPMAAPSGLRATTTAPNNLNMQAQQPRNPQQNGITTNSQEEGVPQRNRSWSDDFHVTGW